MILCACRASNPTDSSVISTEMTFQLWTTEIGLILWEWALFRKYLILALVRVLVVLQPRRSVKLEESSRFHVNLQLGSLQVQRGQSMPTASCA